MIDGGICMSEEKLIGLKIEGVISKSNGEPLTLDEFIDIVEANNLSFGGMTKSIDLNADEASE